MRRLLVLLVAGTCAALPVAAQAERSVDAILADFVEAIGGKAKLEKHKSLRIAFSVSMRGLGIAGTAETVAKAPAKARSEIKLPGVGSLLTGSDGKRTWSQDPINGLRILQGAEAEQARIEATFNADLKLKSLYKTVKVVGGPEAEECLELTPKLGAPVTRCFDATTHLPVTDKGKQTSPQGEVPYTRTVSDWREIDGMKYPGTIVLETGPMTIEMKVTSVKLDEPVADALFALPKPAKP